MKISRFYVIFVSTVYFVCMHEVFFVGGALSIFIIGCCMGGAKYSRPLMILKKKLTALRSPSDQQIKTCPVRRSLVNPTIGSANVRCLARTHETKR